MRHAKTRKTPVIHLARAAWPTKEQPAVAVTLSQFVPVRERLPCMQHQPSVRERETTRQGKMQNTLHSSGDRRLQWKVLLHANVQSGVGGTWRKAHVPPPDPPAVHRCTTALAVIVSPSAAPSPEASRVGRWSAKAHTGNPDLLGAVKAGRTLVGRKLHEGVGQEELVSQ